MLVESTRVTPLFLLIRSSEVLGKEFERRPFGPNTLCPQRTTTLKCRVTRKFPPTSRKNARYGGTHLFLARVA